MLMEMNFPHRRTNRATTAKGSDYALIVAAAASRQLRGVTARLATANVTVGVEETNSYVGGAFLPAKRASSASNRIYENSVYLDASANGKSAQLDIGVSDEPAAMRGMED
jgi:L-amino acid N-acyltransferase YncA